MNKPLLIFLAPIIGALVSFPEADAATCSASDGICQVESSVKSGALVTTDIRVSPALSGNALTTQTDTDHGRASQTWEPVQTVGSCRAVLQCGQQNSVCTRQPPCYAMETNTSAWCGTWEEPWFFGEPFLDGTIYTCKANEDDWPSTPPVPSPPNNDDPSPPGTCDLQEAIEVNQVNRDYRLTAFAKTVKRPPDSILGPGAHDSQFVVEHDAPDRTRMFGQAFGPGDKPMNTISIGTTLYLQSEGSWYRLPPGIGEQMLQDDAPFGPEGIASELRRASQLTPGPCPDERSCLMHSFIEAGQTNTMYLDADTCLFAALIGADENGPRSIFATYQNQNVTAPKDSSPADMMTMMQIFNRQQQPTKRRQAPIEAPVADTRVALHEVVIFNEDNMYPIDGAHRVGDYILFALQGTDEGPITPFSSPPSAPTVNRSASESVMDRVTEAASGSAQNESSGTSDGDVRRLGTPWDTNVYWTQLDETGNDLNTGKAFAMAQGSEITAVRSVAGKTYLIILSPNPSNEKRLPFSNVDPDLAQFLIRRLTR